MVCLIAYDADGNVVGTLDWLIHKLPNGQKILVDFAAHEANGGEHLDCWHKAGAIGSKVWPEYLGAGAPDFKVELAGPPGGKHIAALVHKVSGHRRERGEIEHAIRGVPVNAGRRDIRHIVGGPILPLQIDETGRTLSPPERRERGLPGMGARR